MELTGFIDLHSHSTYSDGTLTPEEIIKTAAQIGLSSVGPYRP